MGKKGLAKENSIYILISWVGVRNRHPQEPGKTYAEILTLIISGGRLQVILAFLVLFWFLSSFSFFLNNKHVLLLKWGESNKWY